MDLVLLLLAHAALVLGVWGEADHLHRHRLVAGGAHHDALRDLHGPDGEDRRRGRPRRRGERWDLGKRGYREGAMEELRGVVRLEDRGELEERRGERHGQRDEEKRRELLLLLLLVIFGWVTDEACLI